MFSETKKRLLEIAASCDDGKHIRQLGGMLRTEIANEAPISKDGEATLRSGFPNARIQYWRKGMGVYGMSLTNKSKFGSSSDRAPKGTIKAFLDDFPKFKSRRKGREAGGQNRSTATGKFRKVAEFKAFKGQMLGTSAYAWWALSPAAKVKLKEERMKGKYGGTPGRAPYMWVQDKGTPEGAAGASKAGLTKDDKGHFIARAFAVIRRYYGANYLKGFWKRGRR